MCACELNVTFLSSTCEAHAFHCNARAEAKKHVAGWGQIKAGFEGKRIISMRGKTANGIDPSV